MIKHELDNSLPPIESDAAKLRQVFLNLLINALDAMPEGGTLTVKTSGSTEQVSIMISDTGIGIDEEDLPKVFDKFEQFKRDSASGEKGTGLGLPIVKGIIELHKGRVWVESKIRQGSKFVFILPKYTQKEFFKENKAMKSNRELLLYFRNQDREYPVRSDHSGQIHPVSARL